MRIVIIVALVGYIIYSSLTEHSRHPSLYLVAIMFCQDSIPEDKCDNLRAREIERIWIYRPSIDACVDFATDVLLRGSFDLSDRYAKVFCLRSEPFQDASHTQIIGGAFPLR